MDTRREVEELAHQYLTKVSRSGPDDIMAVCPFHVKADGSPERSPSFALSLSKGLYFCHSCEEAGNLYTLLRHLQVPRSVIESEYRTVINAASSNSPHKGDSAKPDVEELRPISEELLGLFDFCPKALLEEGFTEEVLQRFDVGFDKQHMRITFPLRDLRGKLSGISGRSVVGASPRYKVYGREYEEWGFPSRVGWNKGMILYNAHVVLPAVFYFLHEVEVYVVEGFKACMWMVQHGLTSTVALMGTHLSMEQRWILEHMGATVYLFLDHDAAGQTGTMHSALELMKSVKVRIVPYPERFLNTKAQPSDLTAEELKTVKERALTVAEWIDHGRIR